MNANTLTNERLTQLVWDLVDKFEGIDERVIAIVNTLDDLEARIDDVHGEGATIYDLAKSLHSDLDELKRHLRNASS